MIPEVLKVGDKLIVDVPQDNREWGWNPAPDGTVVEIVLIDNYRMDVKFPDGSVQTLPPWFFKPFDNNEYDLRVRKWVDYGRAKRWQEEQQRIAVVSEIIERVHKAKYPEQILEYLKKHG